MGSGESRGISIWIGISVLIDEYPRLQPPGFQAAGQAAFLFGSVIHV